MTKHIKIEHKFNEAYKNDGDDKYSRVKVMLDGKNIFSQSASEQLAECPEDALFHRDLNDPLDIVDLIEKLVGNNTEYKIEIESILED